MNVENLINLKKDLLELCRVYKKQSNEENYSMNSCHSNSHDNSGGHPNYHNNSHDNTPSRMKVKLAKNVSN